ncbi:MAG: 16S rRNA (cytidine(1402)-2'-O)-methyltransferase [Acidiphilium sp.]|nr:16S rRNA (cytidine(1402)-2'-O)-methyltransferase [Acidiphilium sp.]MDD4934903.1 16S rRNA (cytidine(1402)-2'-O)-methyltransferase [Acidiphilium sp.]
MSVVTSETPVQSTGPAADLRPALVLVSTPIGNLGDLAPRAVAALRDADIILCEDTRVTAPLLSLNGIGTRLQPLHDHNEAGRTAPLIDAMRGGRRFALVSDAGAPLIADPGFRLVRAAIAAGLTVSAVPGPNAAVMALALSGLPPHPFLFMGFLPPRSAARRAVLERLAAAERAGLNATLVFYEAPHRLVASLDDCVAVLGDRPASVGRELTKRFEEIRRDRLAGLAAHFRVVAPRGEITLVIGPAPEHVATDDELDDALRAALVDMSIKDAAATVARDLDLPRKQVYARALTLREDEA